MVLGAIAAFIYMIRSSRAGRRNSIEYQREEAERERRAEAIATQARRELAEERKSNPR
jgi:molybdopterin synthase catalytic subunit